MPRPTAGLGSASVLPPDRASSCRCAWPHGAGLCRRPPLPAGWAAAGTQAVSPLFLQLPGAEGALGQRAPGVSPAWQCSLGGPCSQHGGMLQAEPYEAETPLPSWGEVPPQQLLSGQSWWSSFAQLCPANTCPAPSSPLPLLSARLPGGARLLRGSLQVLPGLAGEGKGGLGLTQLFLCPLPLHRPPEGVEGARVTQLPSIKLLLQELSGRHAVSVPPVSALPPDAFSAQHQVHHFSPSAFFPLPR